MKAILAAAITVTAATAAYADPPPQEAVAVGHRVCTRIQLRGGSRISYQRVCRTEAEWRDRLGPDWRQVLAGREPDDDLEGLAPLNRDSVAGPNANAFERSFGRPGGGTTGPQ